MRTKNQTLFEHAFFFAIFAVVSYLVWKLIAPFIGTLALAAILVTICYPLHDYYLRKLPRWNKSLVSFFSLFTVLIGVVTPIVILSSYIVREAHQIYTMFSTTSSVSLVNSVERFQSFVQLFVPNFSVDFAAIAQEAAGFVVNDLVSLFANTASTVFLLIIALIASFYFFRDGKYFTEYLVALSPLKDVDDMKILSRLATAVRSVVTGTVAVAIIQGVLTAIGLAIFGFDRAILWGCVAAIGALIPGVGTTIVFVPAVIFLVYTGAHLSAIALVIWGVLAVGLIDNMLGPYIMSRGNHIHPFMVLLSVLGGIIFFGPIGFILGPVIVSFFFVLLELYGKRMV